MLKPVEDVFRAIVLGIVQGLTEFLPISSSGHLILVRELLGWDFEDDLTFDVALHLGTLVAVITYFWSEWRSMLHGVVRLISGDREHHFGEVYDGRLFALIVIGCIPTAIVGLAIDSWAEDDLRRAGIVGVSMIIGGAALYAADRFGRRTRDIEHARLRDSVVVGGAQALSLIPGVSRSGITITAGLAEGFQRADAARFSFLLATPAIGGAALLKLSEAALDGIPSGDIAPIIAGTVTAGVVGWLAIRYLLRYVQTRTYLPFVIYRFVVGALVLVFIT
jgi:undecaprenyl-diphosphatase